MIRSLYHSADLHHKKHYFVPPIILCFPLFHTYNILLSELILVYQENRDAGHIFFKKTKCVLLNVKTRFENPFY